MADLFFPHWNHVLPAPDLLWVEQLQQPGSSSGQEVPGPERELALQDLTHHPSTGRHDLLFCFI